MPPWDIKAQHLRAARLSQASVYPAANSILPAPNAEFDYDYPTPADVIGVSRAGFRVIRLPFLARRLLGAASRPESEATDLERVATLIDTAAQAGDRRDP